MKRLLPFALVALLVLVPAGVVLAAKAVKAKNASAKVSHRSAKTKAANEALVAELLKILDETDNKTTFAACCECLTQMKPPREVVVPAIIRKADKMGWLRPDSEDTAMIGEFLDCFLPNKQRRQHETPHNVPLPYNIQYPYPQPFAIPPSLPTPPASYPPACPVSMPRYATPDQTSVCPCPCPNPCTCVVPCPCPTGSWRPVPQVYVDFPILSVGGVPTQDKMTTDLLKILNDTESKVTFFFVVETLAGHDDHWDAIVPAVIRKADKMGWLRLNEDDFTEGLFKIITAKVMRGDKEAAKCVPMSVIEFVGSGTFAVEVEMIPMPHTAEMIPMPHDEASVFSFYLGLWQ